MNQLAQTGLKASDLMTASPRTCSSFSTVVEAVLIFRDQDCGAVPVVDGGKPIGILTDRDVALALAELPDLATRSVSEIMTAGVATVHVDDSLDSIYEVCLQNSVRRVLVVDSENHLVGVVAWADLLPRLTSRHAGELVTKTVEAG